MPHAIPVAALIAATVGLPAIAAPEDGFFRPIRPGEVAVSGVVSAGFQQIQLTGQVGVDVAYGLTPSLEVVAQVLPVTLIRGMGNADPWQFNQVDGGLSLRWFPFGSERLWYVAPALRGGKHTFHPIVGPGIETGLEGRIGERLVLGAGAEAAVFSVPDIGSWIPRVGLQTRIGYRF